MYLYQYVILIVFLFLYFNDRTKYAATRFLSGWCFYICISYDLDASLYYAVAAFIELCIGFSLNKKHKIVSYLSYFLIIINLFGFYLYKNQISPLSYDIIYALISVTQVLVLIARGAIHGGNRYYYEPSLVFIVDFDSGEARDTMCKNQSKKKKSQ